MIRISATLISKINDVDECPYKVKRQYIDKDVPFLPTQSMKNGLFFEQEVLGVKPGSNPVLPHTLKNGKPSTDAKRIIDQANKIKSEILPMYGIDLSKSTPFKRFQIEFKEDDLTLSGEFDLLCEMDDPELGKVNAIIDLKLTKNINYENSLLKPNWSWRYPQNRDHTQAYMYKYAYQLLFKTQPQFYYFVFDYKNPPEHKIIRKKVGEMELNELKTSIDSTVSKIKEYDESGWNYNPSYLNCKNCPLLNSCKHAVRRPPVDEV